MIKEAHAHVYNKLSRVLVFKWGVSLEHFGYDMKDMPNIIA